MVDATYIDNDRVQVIQNDEISFDTDRPSVALYPDSSRIVLTGQSITFPSILQRSAYYRDAYTAGMTRCETWSTFIWQEWGPDEVDYNERYFPLNPSASDPGPTTRNLPQTLLGTVPADSDYLDIRVRLTRTTVPPNILGTEPPLIFFQEGEWITLPGGSCPCETIGGMTRHFDIVRTGNNIYLRRFQSVRNANVAYTVAPGGGPQRNLDVNESGWNSSSYDSLIPNYDGSPSIVVRSNYDLAVLLDVRGPDNTGTKRPFGPNACTGVRPNLTSVYSADIVITPGVHRT